jgi:hypothetical protein
MDSIDDESPEYEASYEDTCKRIGYVVKSFSERCVRPIQLAAEKGGEVAVQALFDAVVDQGHRWALDQALNSPKLRGWLRERLVNFLYGGYPPVPYRLPPESLD